MKTYVVIDVEMCRVQIKRSSYPHKNEIIRIGAVMLDESYEMLSEFLTYVKPRHGKINNYISNLTGITERIIKEALDIEEALLSMLQWIGVNEVIFYSWSATDFFQIRKEILFKCQENSCWDILLDKKNWIDYQEKLGERLEYSRKLRLSEALEMAELEKEGRQHDGLDDAYNTARLIAKLESQADYLTLIEKNRVREEKPEPLTTSMGGSCKA